MRRAVQGGLSPRVFLRVLQGVASHEDEKGVRGMWIIKLVAMLIAYKYAVRRMKDYDPNEYPGYPWGDYFRDHYRWLYHTLTREVFK
jgi:hypothetical protein